MIDVVRLVRFVKSAVFLTGIGRFVSRSWESLPLTIPGLTLDDHIVMPNHLHGLLMLDPGEQLHRRRDAHTGQVIETAMALGEVIRRFKAKTAREIHDRGMTAFQWQGGLYEHIVEDEADRERVREYMARNAEEWELDQENPARTR